MSHAGLILGLAELEVERVGRNDAISVYAKPNDSVPSCLHCGHDPRVAGQGDVPADLEAHPPR